MQNLPICRKYMQTRASSLQQHRLQQQRARVFIPTFFGCRRLWVFSSCQGRQAGRLGPEGAGEEAPATSAWSSPSAGSTVPCPWHPATRRHTR